MDERIRTSDADRDRVTERLREHFAEGRLSRAELDERVTAALSAKTYGDLRRVLTDLPEPGLTPRPFGRQARHWPWPGLARGPGLAAGAGLATGRATGGQAPWQASWQAPWQAAAGRRVRPGWFRRGPRLFPLLLLALLLLVVLPGSGAAVVALKVLTVVAALMLVAGAVATFVVARAVRRMRRNWYWSAYQQVQDHFQHHGLAWSWPDPRDPSRRSSRP